MILRSDQDPPCCKVPNRVVDPPVPEWELESRHSQCERNQLMTQTNPEEWGASEQSPHRMDLSHKLARIAGPIADQYGTRRQVEDRARVVTAGDNDCLHAVERD